ncbi:MAG: hypothetical protein HKO53_16050 [Gemmatimonadetes bacterium]|nr:hypothetical protein [Gemmatimonadota bacterium]
MTNPADLPAYSNEHLDYEVRMFYGAVSKLLPAVPARAKGYSTTTTTAQPVIQGSWTSKFHSNARIEALVLHYRNLVMFLFPDEYAVYGDDVFAPHFVAGSDPWGTWIRARSPLLPDLKSWKTRADKELAHLTIQRQSGAGAA